MSEQGWALIPGEDRFESVDARYSCHHISRPWRSDPRYPPRLRDGAYDHDIAAGHRYGVPRLGWTGIIYSTDADGPRALTLVRVAEGAVLFFAWLKKQHEAGQGRLPES